MVLLKYFSKEYKKEWLAEVDTVRGMCCDRERLSNLLHYRWHSKGEKHSIFYNFYISVYIHYFYNYQLPIYTYILISLLYRRNKCLSCVWSFCTTVGPLHSRHLGTKELKVAVLQRWPLCGSSVGEMTPVSFRGLEHSYIKKLPILRI